MKLRAANLGLLVLSTVFQPNTFGETAPQVLQPRNYSVTQAQPNAPIGKVINQQQPVRKIASVNEKSYENIRTRKSGYRLNPDRASDIRLFLFGGMSSMGSADGAVQSFRETQKIGTNSVVGLGADMRLQRYFGLELDTYYGIAPTQTILFDEEETQTKKLQHMGGMFNLKTQFPTYLGNIRIVPKIGAGYGMLMLKQSTNSQFFNDTFEASETVKGIYGTVGFDIEPISWMVMTADFAQSITGSGSYNVKSSTATDEAALNDAGFNRLRLGLFFRVHPNVLIGGNYIRRSMSYAVDDSGSETTTGDATSLLDISSAETLSQIAGTIMFQF